MAHASSRSARGAGACGSGTDGRGAGAPTPAYCNGYRMVFSGKWTDGGPAGNFGGTAAGTNRATGL
ncbi:hypothetical protein BC2230_30142 [Burkholderia cepacia]